MKWRRKSKAERGIERLRAEHPQIQRYFELSLFLLTATGFATLAGTGKLDPLSLIVITAALVIRALLLLQRRNLIIPERWINYITLFYVAFYGLDYLLLSRQFIPATVHLVLFSLIVKIFSIHRERDYLYIAVLSFAMVLAAAVLTVDSLFFLLFGIFLLLALTTATSMEMRRSWAESRARNVATEEEDAPAEKVDLSPPLARTTFGLAITILLFASAIFFLLPRRLTAGYLSSFRSQGELISGFRDDVQLGEIGRIQQSDAVVMHLSFLPGGNPPADFKLRGVALSTFMANRWFNTREYYVLLRAGAGFRAPRLTTANRADRAGSFRYQITFDSESEVVFLIPDPLAFFGNFHLLRVDPAGSIFINYIGQESRKYLAESHPPAPMTSAVENSRSEYPAAVAIDNLQLPPIDPRIRKLAGEITAKQTTKFQKARTVEQYLLSHYGYTLELPATLPPDPLANFLFTRKRGHCEYFASSMVVMLRTLGIPARVVNGFRGGEYNDITGSYIIRAKDAHSWVEAYFPDYGWYTFDPTPGTTQTALSRFSRLWLYADAMREFWQEWVVNYDFSHHSVLSFRLTREGQLYWGRTQEWAKQKYDLWVQRFIRLKASLYSKPRSWALWLVSGVLSIFLLVKLAALLRTIRNLKIARTPEKAPQSAATIWYARLLKLLSRRGYKKNPAQTSQEFTESIQNSSLKDPLRRFTESYERARFGDSAEAAARLPELYEEVESVSTK